MAINKTKKDRVSVLGSVDVSDISATEQNEILPKPASIKVNQSSSGRKRLVLIPDDVDKTISIQLPSSLIKKIQQYGLEHGQTMKEVIGLTLLEKFMR